MGASRTRYVIFLKFQGHGTIVASHTYNANPTDFTKQYNRLRQHVAVRTGNAQGITSSINQKASVATLPAVNLPRTSVASAAPTKQPVADQLTALSKFSSRIARIDTPYVMGVGVNRKGPSSYANVKDKSDRATSEQVLDPRTRLILFKMIGRGLIHEVNGCVSTGKEVSSSYPLLSLFGFVLASFRLRVNNRQILMLLPAVDTRPTYITP